VTAAKSTPKRKPSKSQTPAAEADFRNAAVTVEVTSLDPKEQAAATARKLTRPEVAAASIIERWQNDTHDVNAVVNALATQVDDVNGGSLARAEAMLISQAHSLDVIFTCLARRATGQQYLAQWETYMKMAMKAQNQCRMTLETLANVKNPPVYARQANINNGGQQQVNNGSAATTPTASTRAPQTDSEQSKLLEASSGKWMDTGAQGQAGRADSELAPVGTLDGAAQC